MPNISRRIANNIVALIYKNDMSEHDFAMKMNYSETDLWKVLEGKVVLPPFELKRIAILLGVTKAELINSESDMKIPELEYRHEDMNPENLDKILDLIDEYVLCREEMHKIE